MDISYENHIGIYKGAFPPGFCEHVVREFELAVEDGAGATRQQSEGSLNLHKDDLQVDGSYESLGAFQTQDGNLINTRRMFFEGLQQCFEHYTDKYSVLKGMTLRARTFKLQKSIPGQGYHVWHCEQGSIESASRALVYILYLNTLEPEDGGETEFLYQKKRYRPEENTVIIWPASYTHTHRGNTVLGENSKYIATGWFHIE